MFSRAQLKLNSKQMLTGYYGKFILILLIEIACAMTVEVPFVGIAAMALFVPIIEIGSEIGVYLKQSKGETAEIENVFDGFRDSGIYLRLLSTYWLIILYTFLWSMLFIIPGIVKSYSYSLALYIILDNPDMTPREAIKESQRLMNGHKSERFFLDMSFLGWMLLSTVTFGIVLLYVIPYMQMTLANYYQYIKTSANRYCGQEMP